MQSEAYNVHIMYCKRKSDTGGWMTVGSPSFFCNLLTNITVCLLSPDGVVTLTSSVQGAICPREEVTLTCTVTEESSLWWSSPAFDHGIRYYYDEVGYVRVRGIFTATLISAIPNPVPHRSDLTSTLRVIVTPEAMLNGTVITCFDYFNIPYYTDTTLILAGNSLLYLPNMKGINIMLQTQEQQRVHYNNHATF